jgi:hypothetical protein
MAYPDLTTRANVRAFLQKPTGDTAQDTMIDSLISRASLAIMRYCDREFVSSAAGSTARLFELELLRDGWLDLAPYDAQAGSITQVRLDTDVNTPRILTTSEWRPFPIPSRDGIVTALRIIPTSLGGYHRFKHRQVEVTATWGWTSTPADVEHAAIVTTAIWLRRDVAAFSTTFSLDEDRIERPEGLPSAVRAILSAYRRPGVG